jgi:transposase-like protein
VGLPIYERMSNSDFEVFDGKSFKDLCKDVVERSQNKKDQLDTLISDIRNQIKQPNDIQVFMPRIKELLEVSKMMSRSSSSVQLCNECIQPKWKPLAVVILRV